jgi:hypothetical protein
MLRADLHVHSNHSTGTKIWVEGLNTPTELVKQAERISVDVLALTDHNSIAGLREAKIAAKRAGIVFIPGEEVSTKQGHMLALGIEELIPEGTPFEEALDRVHEQGGIAVAPHPFDLKNAGLGYNATYCDAIEVFNAINLDRVSNWSAKRFAKKLDKPMTAGSDAHCVEMMGRGITLVDGDADIDSVLRAILKSKCSVECSYVPISVLQYWSIRRLQLSYNYVLDYIHRHYPAPKRWLSSKLLALSKYSPGKIDYFFQAMAYVTLFPVMVYSGVKTAGRVLSWKLRDLTHEG